MSVKWSHMVPSIGIVTLCVVGCASNNLYFLSAQRIGVEVAASDPAANGSPKVLLGYESVKGVINPVKDDNGLMRGQAYSVIGITGTDASGSGDVGLAVSEWFATGRAAELLAEDPMTPAVLAGTALTKAVVDKAGQEQLALTYTAVAATQVFLDSLEERTPRQDKVLADLDGLSSLVADLSFNQFDSTGNPTPFVRNRALGATGWNEVEAARMAIVSSLSAARNRSVDSGIDALEQEKARNAAVELSGTLEEFDKQILSSDAAQAAWSELTRVVRAGGK